MQPSRQHAHFHSHTVLIIVFEWLPAEGRTQPGEDKNSSQTAVGILVCVFNSRVIN